MSITDSAVGAILKIPDPLLAKITVADQMIRNLAKTSEKSANAVNKHWGEVATNGLQAFIDKIGQAKEAIKNLGGATTDVKFNTDSATQQMSDFTNKVQSDSSKVSQSIQDIASIPIDTAGIKEWATSTNKTFQDVQDIIKGLKNGLREIATESPLAQTQLQAIKAWDDYYKSVSKVNEEKDKMARKTADIEKAISNVRAQIDHENQAWERSKTKIDEAQRAIDQFKQTNPTFNWRDATLEFDRLKEKYNELYEKFKTAPSTDLSGIRQQMDATRASFEALDNQLLEYNRLIQRKRDAEENASGETYQKSIAKLQERYDNLTKDLEIARSAQASFNAELEKGNTAKSLASEYAKLTKRLQDVNDAMNKYQASGGNVNSTSFQALQSEWQNIMARRKEIEKMDIAEVNQYRTQLTQSAYQADLSAFVQAEAQKTAEAKKQADERARMQAESLNKYLNSAQGAMWYSRQLNKGNIDNSYENRERAIKQLENAIKSLDSNDKNYDKTLQQLTRTLNTLKQAQDEVNNAMKLTKPMVSPQDAINAAKNATSLKQLKDAYKQLKEVMDSTNPKSQDWTNMNTQLKQTKTHIDEIKKKMGELQSQSAKTSNVLGQLQGRIAAAFSVGAISGFIKKMVEVRAQFELQRVALGAIIQDRDEANKIFTQVQNMALESPFNIMQLEKATKQIAAFGFETKKLVPTMKMFADISAGLGVEIDRLVLVMGHLKARNFLEGCLGFGTPVKMYDGSVKSVEDIERGERIMGDDDTPRIIKQVIRGKEQMYKVIYTDGLFRCNEKHILTLYNTEKDVIEDVYVLDYLKTPDAYKGVKRSNGRFEYFDIAVKKDAVDDYYGFVIDGNRRFQLGDGVVTHNTMVRQFTNMGFNVLGELSKYYTELEGKMVSVGEVQDRVKKKMISFEDVEEVLKRVTSAGGMFYDMQKKQSDSLWGQMQRIQDAYDLMLNEIGQSNEGILKSALSTIRSLISNWRAFKPAIVATVAAMGAFGAAMFFMRGLPALISSVKNGIFMMRVALLDAASAQKTLNAAQTANVWGALLALIVAVTMAVYQYIFTQDQLTEAMNRVRSEGIGNMYELITQYRELADAVKDTTKPYEERKKALEELHRVYGDILPAEMLEIDNIRQMKDGYVEATDAIREYSEAKTKANIKAEIDNEFSKELTTAVSNDAKAFASSIIDGLNQIPQYADMTEKQLQGIVTRMMTEVVEEVKSGNIAMKDASTVFKQRFIELFNLSDSDQKKISSKVTWGLESAFKAAFSTKTGLFHAMFGLDWFDDEGVERVVDKITEKKGDLESLFKDPIDTNPQVVEFNNLRDAINGYINTVNNLKDVNLGEGRSFNLDEQGHITNYVFDELSQQRIQEYNDAVDAAVDKNENFKVSAEELNNAFLTDNDTLKFTSDTIQNYLIDTLDKIIKKLPKSETALKKLFIRLRNEIEQTKLTPIQEDVKKTLNLVNGKYGISQKLLNKFKLDAIVSYDDARKAAKNLSKEAEENIKRIAQTRTELIGLGLTAAEAQAQAEKQVGDGKTTEAEYKQMQQYYTSLAKALGDYDKSKKKSSKGSDKELKKWQDLKKAIEDVSTAYDKYRKSFDVDTSNAKIEELYGPAFKELGYDIKQFYKNGKYDAEELVEALKILKKMVNSTTEERKKFQSELTRKIGVTEVEIEVKASEDAEKKLKQKLDDMFASYELSKELKKLGLSVDLTFMLGGEPLDLNDLRAKITKQFQDAGGEKASENDVKEYKDRLKKIEELEYKERKERVKEYHKYFVKTVGERARIELEYLKKMDDVRQMYEFTEAQRQDAIRQLTEEKNKKLSEQMWKDFKNGAVYQMMFQDLDVMSEKTLTTMRNELERIKTSFKELSPKELKEINKAIKDIDNNIATRNPFKTLGKAFKDLIKFSKERKKLEKEFQDAIKKSGELSDEIAKKEAELNQLRGKSALYKADQVQSQIDNLNEQIAELEKDGVTPEEQAKIDALRKEIELLEEKKKKLMEIAKQNSAEQQSMYSKIKDMEGEVASLNAELANTNQQGEQTGDSLSKGSAKAAMIKNAFYQIKSDLEESVAHLDSIMNGLDRMGVLSDAAKDNFESFKDIFSSVNDIAEGGIKVITGFMSQNPADIVNGTLQGIAGTINLIASIFEIGDKKKERQIKSLIESVEELDKAYQKLEKSLESAYNFSKYNTEFDRAEYNLKKQKKAYEDILNLEESKKKSDKDKIKDYEEKLEELAEAEEELYEKRHEKYGSTNDVWDEANNFVDAWLDAYKETGDGLDALNESWDEFYENLVKKQAASAVLGNRMDKYIKEINDAIDKNMDSEYDYIDMFKDIGERMKSEFDATNEDLKKLFEYAGIGTSGSLLLSDLQKGIQNITEPQAAAIEAYLNSMRFAVFRHTEQLDILIATIQMQYGNNSENPVVAELKGIRGVLDSIDRRLGSVINTQGRSATLRVGV
ncbi:Hint domain-containing homing endonuclease [Clavibacter sp.]|uniref:Hint domain-containing homing endonuclease n=1 Tax=Clavibacter sp. TaxID=1871044 RepID=UPI00199CA7CF|nr:Hint domain-containing homing endonuclease [Clavibacter sp.]MBD5381939.1 hypothetical protein [Clavibacter sp.]